MLAGRRAVVIRDVAGLRKGARVVLDQYLVSPSADTVLVLVAVGDDSDATLEARATAVAFPLLGEGALGAWITQRARRDGADITPEATALLAEAVGADLAHAAGELEKLASYVQGRPIDAAAIEAIVGVRRGEELGTLLDTVAHRDAARAVELVPRVLAQPKLSAVQCVGSLIAQTLAMGWGRAMLDQGASSRQLRGEYFNLLKQSGGSVGRRWGDAVQVWVSNLPRWSAHELRQAADLCLRAEIALKDTRTTTDDAVVMTVILALCATAPSTVAA
jgi:DNA polymerase-3 subunit delta